MFLLLLTLGLSPNSRILTFITFKLRFRARDDFKTEFGQSIRYIGRIVGRIGKFADVCVIRIADHQSRAF